MSGDVLDRFSPATAAWFRGSFSAPTAAQEGAWEAISSGHHALVVAPTGSGKTLSAFLWALDRLASQPLPEDKKARCRVLYVSPMKALAVDVERNLRSPLVGIRHAATRLGRARARHHRVGALGRHPGRRAPRLRPHPHRRAHHDARVALPHPHLGRPRGARRGRDGHPRRGARPGRHQARRPPGPLASSASTPTSSARRSGSGCPPPSDPVEEVARYLAGGRPVDVVQPPSTKQWDLKVVVPVPDMAELGQPTGDLSGAAAGQEQRASIWPHVEERIVDLVAEHTSTLVFSNSRRLAERLTTRLNEIWEERVEAAGGRRHRHRAGCRAARRRAHPQPRAGHGPVRRLARRSRRARPRPPRLGQQGAARHHRGGPQVGPPARRGRHEQPRARHRHGRRRPRRAGRVAAVGGLRAAARRPGRPPGRRGQPRGALPEVPRRPRADRGRRRADARRPDRGAAPAQHPARRARPAGGGDVRPRRVDRRRRARPGPPLGLLLHAHPAGARVGARHARRALPQRRVRRAARPHHLGPLVRHPHRPPRRPAARRHLGRHHPRPRAVRRLPRHRRGPRPPGRRARRGDGLRVAGRRPVHPRHEHLAHRGHHPRPGARHAGARAARAAAVLEGRLARPPRRAGPRRRRLRPRGRGADPGCRARAGQGGRARRLGRRQPARLPARAARGHRPRARRPGDRRRAVPRRARRLAGRHPLAVRRAGARPVGAGRERPDARPVRRRRAGDARRRRHRAAPARHRARRPRRRARARRRPRAARPGHPRPRRRARPGHRGDRRLGAVRGALPRVRRPGPAAPPPPARPPPAAVAAAPARLAAARGRQPVPDLPDRARGGARVRAGRLRRARAWST